MFPPIFHHCGWTHGKHWFTESCNLFWNYNADLKHKDDGALDSMLKQANADAKTHIKPMSYIQVLKPANSLVFALLAAASSLSC